MTVQLGVVVAAGQAGRAIVPTLRSILGDGPADGSIEILVAVDERQHARTLAIIEAAGLIARVVVAEGVAAQRNAGVSAASADIIAILDGGDLAGASWFAGALDIIERSEPDVVVHPEAVLAFGARTAHWSQPPADTPDVRRLLPAISPYASPIIARRALLMHVPYLDAEDGAVDASWLASSFGADVRHVTAPHTSAFVRTWDAHPPWRVPAGPSLPAIAWLRDAEMSKGAPARPNGLRERAGRGPRAVRAAGRAIPAVVEPWRATARMVEGRLRGTDRFPDWFVEDWRTANLLEPLVPYPRAGSVARLERWGDPWPAQDREAAAGYWRLVRRLPADLDYLFVGPWVRMGGGDSVLLSYVDAVRRLDPAASIALLTTEPIVSTRLDELGHGVRGIELREVIALETDRPSLVERILPVVLAQYQPAVLHAINSTVAFDVVERYGTSVAQSTNIFLSSFAIDRAADGERTSVMFLRRPDFLDPVRGVLVDSATYIDRLVREQGYARERFIVQNSVIEVPIRARPEREFSDPGSPLRVLWAGRFDIPKRLDVLARVVEVTRRRGLPVEFHFHGAEVMGDPTAAASLAALSENGAIRHPPFSGFSSLPLDEYDAYVLTSEWEGVPTTVLESMAAGIPVVAPLVGGVGEVLDERSGYPIERFDDAEAYVDAFAEIIADYAESRRRAAYAGEILSSSFSREGFDERLKKVPGYLKSRR